MTTVRGYLSQLYNDNMIASGQTEGLAFGQLYAGGATTTSSTAVVLAANAPSWVVAGMPVYDVTAGGVVGTVSAVSNTSVTLAANATTAIATGDVLQFGFGPQDQAAGAAAGSDVRGLVELCIQKMNEAAAIVSYLTTDVITSSEDSAAHTILGDVASAL